MVLGGRVNKSLVSLIQQAGGKAVGLCGKDGDLLRARQMVEKDIGYVPRGPAARAGGGVDQTPLACWPRQNGWCSPPNPHPQPLPPPKTTSYVGEVTRVDATLLRSLVSSGYIPVVATVATDESGQALNVNADTAAGEIAAALQAEKLILMTDVPGVLRDKDDVTTKFAELNIKRSRELMQEGIIAGGMIPKVRACLQDCAGCARPAVDSA